MEGLLRYKLQNINNMFNIRRHANALTSLTAIHADHTWKKKYRTIIIINIVVCIVEKAVKWFPRHVSLSCPQNFPWGRVRAGAPRFRGDAISRVDVEVEFDANAT